jgi:DNA-binding MarR family transcriptional regulator
MQHPFHGFISYWIKKNYRDLNSLYDQKLAHFGLTASQVNVLEQLWSFGDGMTQKELHERLSIRPASLTNLLDALVTGGWVVRKPDSKDARVKRIFLTKAGQAQKNICMEIMADLEQTMRQGMVADEVSLLLFSLRKTHKNIPTKD